MNDHSSEVTHETTTDQAGVLIQSARLRIYAGNAFRVLELPVDINPRGILKRQQVMEMSRRTGRALPPGPGRLLPLEIPPDEDAVRQAVQRLQDPERRLVDELFWFWQPPVDSATGAGLEAMVRGDVNDALKLWEKDTRDPVALHNLAVAFHVQAMDAENRTLANGAPTDSKTLADHWRRAFTCWEQLLRNSGFWQSFTDRIQAFGDPRLTPDMIPALKDKLPEALLLINARLALAYAEKGAAADALRHVRMIENSGWPAEEALAQAVNPLRARLKLLCETAENEADADPAHGDQPAQRMLEQARPLIQVVDALLPEAHPVRISLHDEVALRVLGCQISYGNKTNNWKRCYSLLHQALKVVSSDSARTRIQNTLAIVSENVYSSRDWCGEGYHDLPQDLLDILESARRQADAGDWEPAIRTLEDLLKGNSPVTLREADRPLVRKALANCLYLRGIARFNTSISKDNEPPSFIERIMKRAEGDSPGFKVTALQARMGTTQSSSYLECMACGAYIDSSYTKFTFKDLPIIVCPSCSNKVNEDEESRKQQLKLVCQDLLLAIVLDKTNFKAKKSIDDLKKAIEGLDVSEADSKRIFIQSGLAVCADFLIFLGDQAWQVRKSAAKALGEMGPAAEAAIPALIRALGDSDRDVRMNAAEALGNIGPAAEAAIPALLTTALGDSDLNVRWKAAAALGNMGPAAEAAIPALVKALGDSRSYVRMYAAEALGNMGSAAEAAIPALIRALKDLDSEVRRDAAWALGKVGPAAEAAIPSLTELLGDSDWKVRRNAAEALRKMGPAAEAAIPSLTEALGDSSSYVRWSAAEALGKMGPAAEAAIPSLTEALGDSDSVVRWSAAEALGNMGSAAEAAIPALIKASGDSDSDVRRNAAEALGKIGPSLVRKIRNQNFFRKTAGILAMVSVLLVSFWGYHLYAVNVKGDFDAACRFTALNLPGPQTRITSLQIVINQTSVGNERIRKAAVEVLHRIGSAAEAAIPALIKALGDSDSDIRQEAAEALLKMGPAAEAAKPALIEALGDPDWTVRRSTAEALGKFGPAAIPALIKALGDSDSDIRQEAAAALGNMGPAAEAAIPALTKALGDSDWMVREAAKEALRKIQKQ